MPYQNKIIVIEYVWEYWEGERRTGRRGGGRREQGGLIFNILNKILN
jgi:hypothetical protein